MAMVLISFANGDKYWEFKMANHNGQGTYTFQMVINRSGHLKYKDGMNLYCSDALRKGIKMAIIIIVSWYFIAYR